MNISSPFFTCANFRSLPAAHGRCSKIICRVLCKIEKVPRGIRGEKSSKDMASSRNLVSTMSYTICVVLLFDLFRSLLTVKSLKNVIQDKLFCYIYHVLQIHYFKKGHSGKTLQTFNHSPGISLRSWVVAGSICKRDPGLKPYSGQHVFIL